MDRLVRSPNSDDSAARPLYGWFYAGEIESGIDRSNVVDCLISSAEFDDRYRA